MPAFACPHDKTATRPGADRAPLRPLPTHVLSLLLIMSRRARSPPPPSPAPFPFRGPSRLHSAQVRPWLRAPSPLPRSERFASLEPRAVERPAVRAEVVQL